MDMDISLNQTLEQSLPDHIKYWLREAAHDCHFVVGCEPGRTTRIGAMKIFLMGHSEPFRKMLNDGRLAEQDDIAIEDMYPESFWHFLICAYGGCNILLPQLNFEDCARLLCVAHKYLADYIETRVSKYLQKLFSPDKIYIALSFPICYESSLKKEVLHLLQLNFNIITQDDMFLKLDKLPIKWITEQEPFNVKEVDIWNAILGWAKHQTGSTDGMVLRSKIFDLLSDIRFLAMDCKDFCKHVVLSGVLYENEVHEIAKSFGSGDPHNIDHISKNKKDRIKQVILIKRQMEEEIPDQSYRSDSECRQRGRPKRGSSRGYYHQDRF